MSGCLDQITQDSDTIPIINNTKKCANADNNNEEWRNTVFKTVCIPEIEHLNVLSSITPQQEERHRDRYLGGEALRNNVASKVEESMSAIRAVEREIDALIIKRIRRSSLQRRNTSKTKRSLKAIRN